jgi:outer membrane receptor protein involved in Fe transport
LLVFFIFDMHSFAYREIVLIMKRAGAFICFLLVINPVLLTGQVFLTGRVMDAQTLEPLDGANIQLISDGTGSITDRDGTFRIAIPEVKAQIRISYLGYFPETRWIQVSETNHPVDILLTPASINSNAVVVTATKNRRRLTEVPGRIEWLSSKQLEAFPATQADEYLLAIPGIQVSREHGLLDHTSTVSMRGLGGDQQGRYLVLLDGIPMNKADGGSVNWNSLNPEEISQIEVAKGPGSSLYGGNAMGGVINYIRKKPVRPFEGSAQLEYGGMNTMRGRFVAGGRPSLPDKSIYWGIRGFGSRSNGYVQVPEEELDSTVIATSMKEFGGGLSFGYRINNHHQVEINSGYWWDRRGSGTRIFAETGTYFAHGVLDNSLKYSGNSGKATWSVVAFSTGEDYSRLNESIKASGNSYSYTSYSVTSRRNDNGILLHFDRKSGWNQLSAGAEIKQGSVYGRDIYTTSTDTVSNHGKMRNLGFFVQDQMTLFKDRLFLIAGLRWDHSTFFDGGFFISSPTPATSILGKLQDAELESGSWSQLSPKLALKYSNQRGLSGYFSYGHGFRPSVLDDMCRSGFIRGGFKRANPGLGPENLNNFETGIDLMIGKTTKLSISGYYSVGQDLIYLVSSGDSILQGSKLRPLMEATNISGVRIFGLESSLKTEFENGVSGYLQYAYTHSEISDYQPMVGLANLQGKNLVYVPDHQLSCGLIWRNQWVNISVKATMLSSQWMDDVNTVSIPAYFKIDTRIWTDISNFRFFINGQNLNDAVYLEGHGLLSLGRYISGGISYRF